MERPFRRLDTAIWAPGLRQTFFGAANLVVASERPSRQHQVAVPACVWLRGEFS